MNNALSIAGISAETVKKYAVKPGALPADKSAGVPAAQEDSVITRYLDVTPDMATRWLKANFGNRPVKQDVVAAYARDMVNGVWQPTHQGIAFSDEDKLIDGQHRLLAIVKCGKTVRMMVTFGIRAQIEGQQMTTMDCVDRGATRSVADQLKIQHGLKNGSAIAQVCSTIAHLCVGERMRRLSVGQTLDIYREFKAAVDYVIEHRLKETGLKSAGVLGAFAFVMSIKEVMKETQLMFHRLNSGDEMEWQPTLKLLRDFLTGENATLILASMNRGIAELTVWVLKQQMEGQSCAEMAKEPEDWFKAVAHIRNLQRDRVAKIANIFKLPAVAKVEPVVESHSAPPRTPAQPAAPASAPAKARPSLDKIISAVENDLKISRLIIAGKGDDADLNGARRVFIALALGYGYSPAAIGEVIKRNVEQVNFIHVPKNHLSKKNLQVFDALKKRLEA